ncbi:MAG: metal ABC transporter ATP-binding protein [Deltaproteobacteria bacterium]|nr:metal ABC transporter ATP-binding protein [Deltaproteobacteria bacterium]
MDIIELHGVRVGYGKKPLLPPIDLSLGPGAFLGVVGPNGSGKTTLIRTMIGLLAPVAGEVRYPRGPRPAFGYVPQKGDIDLSFPLTAVEIVLMGRYPRIGRGRRPAAADRAAALRALAEVGVADLAPHAFHELSGGQRQRVLLARALAGEPEVLVLDEPTTGMDLPAERALLDQIAQFAEKGIAVLMVSHQLAAVANYAHDLCIVDRERQAVEFGPVEQVLTPARLTQLYGRPVAVETTRGYTTVFVADPPAGDGSPCTRRTSGAYPAVKP